MRKYFWLFLVFLYSGPLKAQSFGSKANTYALVIGISDYEDEGIKDLNYAHRDAQIFANFLTTKPGGSVPEENIILLTDSLATSGAIVDGLDVLKKKIKKGDKFIFYFAGHGRVEEEEFEPLGFLLAYNTLPNNFQRNALALEKLNKFSRRITLGTKAETLLLLDACHAGELAGLNNNGVALTEDQREEKNAREVRIMACKKNQKSLELSSLGGGRGLFSYYLVKGLSGESADEDDEIVSLDELKSYIKKNVKRTAEGLNHPGGQTPEFSGEEEIKLAFFDRELLEAEKARLALTDLSNEPTEEGEVVVARGFSNKGIYKPFDEAIAQKNLLSPKGNSAYDIYKKLLKKNKKDKRLSAMKSKLIIKLQDEAQHAINGYLKGDQKELNNRLFVEKAKVYKKYPQYLAKAADLAGKDYINYDGIKAKQYYFEGVNARLENSLKSRSRKNLNAAMNLQKKALSFEDKAAYIHNEIGVLNIYLEDFEKAKSSFQYAMKLAPSWVIPYSNLCVLNNVKKDFEEARKWGQKAVDLQPTYVRGQANLGTTLEATGNYLQAEHHYRKGIYHNWDFYLGFEKLAYLYTKYGDYELANHLYREMEIRKKGVFPNFSSVETDFYPVDPSVGFLPTLISSEKELLERIRVNPKDDEAWLLLGKLYEAKSRFEEAENCFLKVIEIKPTAYKVYESIGDLYAGNNKYAQYIVNPAPPNSYSVDTTGYVIDKNGDLVTGGVISQQTSNWKRYEEAISMYRVPIDSLRSFKGVAKSCVKKIWDLYEELERNEEAEDLKELYVFEHEKENELLYGFYNRMKDQYPENPDYWYKQGLWLYKYRNSEWGEMITHFEQVISLDSLHPSRADMFLKLGELYAYTGTLEQEIAFRASSMKTETDDNRQIEIYNKFIQGYQKAIAYSKASSELRPLQTGPKYQLINQYLEFFEPQKALNILEELVDSNQLNVETRRQLIHTYAWTGQLEKAQTYLDWLIKKPIGMLQEDHHTAALFYLAKEESSKAIDSFEKVLEYKPDDKNIQYQIATLHTLNNQKDKALTWLEKSINNGFRFEKVIAYDPALKDLRTTPDFQALIKKYNLETETIP